MKVKKKFQYDNIELKIVERNEPYMNNKEGVNVTRVIAPNGGVVPVHIMYKDTLKKIIERTTTLLDSFKSRGADIKAELTNPI